MRDRAQAAKRGGGALHERLEPGTETSPGIDPPACPSLAPDALFDRNWALALLDRALAALAADLAAEGKAAHFEALKPWLTGDVRGISQADAAARLGMNEGAVKVAVHRLRRRFREQVKSEIAQTLADAREIETELQHLLQAMSR
jgi:RNA polymerase sigma-70 factor (ECF subfamily)